MYAFADLGLPFYSQAFRIFVSTVSVVNRRHPVLGKFFFILPVRFFHEGKYHFWSTRIKESTSSWAYLSGEETHEYVMCCEVGRGHRRKIRQETGRVDGEAFLSLVK